MRRYFNRALGRQLARLAMRGLAVGALATVGWLAGSAGLRSYLASELASTAANADDDQVGEQLAALASLDDAAIDSLVLAATSPRSAVALPARGEIDRLIDRWSMKHELNPQSFELASRIERLADQLAAHSGQFDAAAAPWLERTALSLLNLADAQSAAIWQYVIDDCQVLLDRIKPPATSVASVVGRWPSLETQLPTAAVEPSATAAWTPRKEVAQPPTPQRESVAIPSAKPPATNVAQAPARKTTTVQVAATPATLPTAVLEAQPADTPTTTPAALPADVVADLSLLMRVSGSDMQLAGTAARELAQRGFGRVGQRPARMLLSRNVDDRLALVDLVSTSSDLSAGKWLSLLAYDGAGEVRAAAVGALATSGDPILRKLARELALHDTDPRVAAWVARLGDVR